MQKQDIGEKGLCGCRVLFKIMENSLILDYELTEEEEESLDYLEEKELISKNDGIIIIKQELKDFIYHNIKEMKNFEL